MQFDFLREHCASPGIAEGFSEKVKMVLEGNLPHCSGVFELLFAALAGDSNQNERDNSIVVPPLVKPLMQF